MDDSLKPHPPLIWPYTAYLSTFMCCPLALHFHHQPLIFDRLSSVLYMWQLHQLKLKNYILTCFQVFSKIPFVRVYVHMGNEMARLELVWT